MRGKLSHELLLLFDGRKLDVAILIAWRGAGETVRELQFVINVMARDPILDIEG